MAVGSTRPPNVGAAPAYAGADYSSWGGDGNNFIPQLYANKVLRHFYASSIWTSITNTDYQGQIKAQGDQIVIRRTPTISTSPYSVGTTINYEVPETDSLTMRIDKGLYSAFRIDDIDAVQSDLPLVSMFAKDAAERIKIEVDQEVLEYLASAADSNNSGATAGAISNNIDLGTAAAPETITSVNAIDYIVQINQVLDEANIPSEGRFVVVPAWYSSMLKLGDLRRADVTGDGTGVIRTGLIGRIDRTDVYQNNNLYTLAGNTYIVAGTKEAASFAAQITKTETLRIPDSFGEYWRTLFVYGRQCVQPTCLVNMVATS